MQQEKGESTPEHEAAPLSRSGERQGQTKGYSNTTLPTLPGHRVQSRRASPRAIRAGMRLLAPNRKDDR